MNRLFLAVALILTCGVGVLAQRQARAAAQASGQTNTAVNSGSKSASIQSGTQIAGQLQSTLDARKAQVGDEVVLKTTDSIKSDGQVIVKKGARLFGNVTSVAEKTKQNGESQIGILFNRLESGSLVTPISATISSITQARAQVQRNDDMFASDIGAGSSSSTSVQRAPASGGRGNGGLLGGVTNTVGGVANDATSAVGGVTNTATSTVGGTLKSTTNAAGDTTGRLGRSVGSIQITESSGATAAGGSMLSLQGDNLRLEKGTTFNLVVNQSASVSSSKNP